MTYEKNISMLAPGMPFDGNTYKEKSLGGSETAALFLARELAKTNNVYVFSNTEEMKTVDGVVYVPLNQWKPFAVNTPHDVSIVQRVPSALNTRLNSKLNLLWLHDLGQKEREREFKGVQWNIDQYIAVSDYHRQQLIESMGLPPESVWASRNGIDLSLFGNTEKERDKYKIMYSARPERGLDRLLETVFPRLLEKEPNAWLCIATYDNPTDDLKEFYKYIHKLVAKYGDRIVWKEPLTKEQLYQEYATAGVYLYPTPSPRMKEFREVSCISAMECMASGLPFVSSNLGALPETLDPEAGSLVETDEEMVDEAIYYIHDEEKWEKTSKAGKEAAVQCTWEGVALEWDRKMDELIAERNDNPHRLLVHFWKHSDIQAARKVAEDNGVEWDFSAYDYDLNNHYNSIEETEDESATRSLSRTRLILEALHKQRTGNRVLDFGCAQGTMAHIFKEQIPELEIDAVDISERQIEKAKVYEREGLNFSVGDENSLQESKYDVAIITEVLEHQREPWKFLEKIEKYVKKDGLIILTTPSGPWELNTSEYNHFWEFDPHDLKDMLGEKDGLSLSFQSTGQKPETEDALGFHLITYRANPKKPVRPINMERKVSLQCPRQTVGACILAGPGAEKSLRLHLDSYAHLMDQLVVADTGLSEEARSLFREYGAEFVPAPNPLEEGFERARNAGLEHVWTDWVFWLDTDEHLIEPYKIVKYLRENSYHSYGLHQHHFAVDTEFTPDMPVRLFRRRPEYNTGKRMQWYGAIHEHPEIELNEGPGNVVVLADGQIAHYGYLIESKRQDRFWRNFPLLQLDTKRYPERRLQKHFLCRDSVILAGYYLQENGGVLDDKVQNLCEDAIALYQKYFLGQGEYANVDTHEYYDRALRILNRGFEAKVDIQIGEGMRFYSRDDLEAFINEKLDRELPHGS